MCLAQGSQRSDAGELPNVTCNVLYARLNLYRFMFLAYAQLVYLEMYVDLYIGICFR